MAHHLTDDSFQDIHSEEVAPLDDNIWMEEPVQTGTSASMNSHNHMTCALTLAHTAWISYTPLRKNAPQPPHYKMMHLGDIFNFQDVMTTSSDEDIPDLDDVFGP